MLKSYSSRSVIVPSLQIRPNSDRSMESSARKLGQERDCSSAKSIDSSELSTLSSRSSKSTSLDGSTQAALSIQKKKSMRSKLKSLTGFITGKSRNERQEARNKNLVDSISESDPVASPTGLKQRLALERRKVEEEENTDLDETVYGMEFDNMSTTSSTSERGRLTSNTEVASTPMDEEKKVNPAIEIILFLLDNETRRFEILQLDVDSPFAVVNDILNEIPRCATEPSLKRQTYGVVCDRKGRVMQPDRNLVDYFPSIGAAQNGRQAFAVFAMTSSSDTKKTISASNCVKLARVILQNPRIVQMLLALGVQTHDTIVEEMILEEEMEAEVKHVIPQATTVVPSVTPEPLLPISTALTAPNQSVLDGKIQTTDPTSSKTIMEEKDSLPQAACFESTLSSEPMLPPSSVSTSSNQLSDGETQTNEPAISETIVEEKSVIPPATCVEMTLSSEPLQPLSTESTSSNQSCNEKTEMSEPTTIPVISCSDQKSTPSKRGVMHTLLVLFATLSSVLLYLTLQQIHTELCSAPLIRYGDSLRPGSWRSECGVFSLLPDIPAWVDSDFIPLKPLKSLNENCKTIKLSMDGTTLEIFQGKDLYLQLKGSTCPDGAPSPLEDQQWSCKAWASIGKNGELEIGGKRPMVSFPPLMSNDNENSNNTRSISFRPWPFGESVDLEKLFPQRLEPQKNPKIDGRQLFPKIPNLQKLVLPKIDLENFSW